MQKPGSKLSQYRRNCVSGTNTSMFTQARKLNQTERRKFRRRSIQSLNENVSQSPKEARILLNDPSGANSQVINWQALTFSKDKVIKNVNITNMI